MRYHLLSVDFLLDVVKYDEIWYRSGSSINTEIREVFDAHVRSGIEFHAASLNRRKTNPQDRHLLGLYRKGSLKVAGTGALPFRWQIEHVSKMTEGKYIFSPSFYLEGYWFRLQAGRIKWARADGFSLALFLSVDLEMSGIVNTRGFFIKTESQFGVFNLSRSRYEPTHLPSFDTFHTGVSELGYFDLLKKPWFELISEKNSEYVDSRDSIRLSVQTKLLS